MGRPPIDLSGHRFGSLTAIRIVEHGGKHKPVKWLCKCDCGKEKIVDSQLLRQGIMKDCGCHVTERLTGKRFGKLLVLGPTDKRMGSNIVWECKCDCGNITYVSTCNLMAKKHFTGSCGCMRIEKSTKHGLSKTKIYKAMIAIRDRCNNPNCKHYDGYGGRGITLCEEWSGEHGFENFYNWSISHGYEDGLTIDRIDNNKGYSPDNCRWVTQKVQMNNRRGCRFVTIDGETHSLTEWSEIKGICIGTVRDRLKKGWSEYDAITKPVKGRAN